MAQTQPSKSSNGNKPAHTPPPAPAKAAPEGVDKYDVTEAKPKMAADEVSKLVTKILSVDARLAEAEALVDSIKAENSANIALLAEAGIGMKPEKDGTVPVGARFQRGGIQYTAVKRKMKNGKERWYLRKPGEQEFADV